MKHLKKFNESNEIENSFYHLTDEKHLNSLLNGTKKITFNKHSKSQGNGFYLWKSERDAFEWTGGSKSDILLEYNTNLNLNNFELDYELHGIEFLTFWNTLIQLLKENLNYYYVKINYNNDDAFVSELIKMKSNETANIHKKYHPIFIISNTEITKNDIKFEDVHDNVVDIKEDCPSQSDKYGFFRVVNFSADAKFIYKSMESLDKYGIKKAFKSKLLPKSKAVKYYGNPIKPIRYKKKTDGKWGEWISNS
jgi:hypothetical protein